MSLREIQMRGRQELSKLGERVLRAGMTEISDAVLQREMIPAARNGSGSGTAMLIAERFRAPAGGSQPRPGWFPSLAHRDDIVATMNSRFAEQRDAIIAHAEKALNSRFDLLGFNDLSFGDPIDWLFEPTLGKRTDLNHWSQIDFLQPDVAGDKKVTWELNRHQHFVTFGQAYWMTGDERYVRAFVEQASAWMDANPPKRGINWASSLEAAFRAISWLWTWHLCADSKHLTAGFVARLLKCLVAHGRHIESYLSYYFSPNTHLTGEALGLYYLGTALPELRRARVWQAKGLRILLEQMPIHVRPDGVYFEQSSYYHRYTADFYAHLFVLARANGAKLHAEVEERLVSLFDHLMWITRPDGSSPLIGDDDGGRLIKLGVREADDFRDTLATGAALFGRNDWKFVAGPAAVETLWLLGPRGLENYDGLKPEAPRRRTRAFDESGFYVIRDGWERKSSYALIDCGPHGAPFGGSHAHADSLAVEFAANGVTWLVDPGTFTYTAAAQARDEFRSTSAHNTVTVDGESQSVYGGPFSWRQSAQSTPHRFIAEDGFTFFEGKHDGYERLSDPVTHTRAVLFVNSDPETGSPVYLVVRDLFAARGHHRYAIRFHFPAVCDAVVRGQGIQGIHPSGSELVICAFGSSAVSMRITDGWVSRCYGRREQAPVAVIEAEGVGRQEFVTMMTPATKDPALDAERILAASMSMELIKSNLRPGGAAFQARRKNKR